MNLDLDRRQRAILDEMGVHVWWPETPPAAMASAMPAPKSVARAAPEPGPAPAPVAVVELEALAAAVGLVRQGAVLVTEWQRVWLVLLAAPPSVELQK